MPTLPACPNPLPIDLDSELKRLAVLWAKHSTRPRLDPKVSAHWDRLLELWISDESLPLFIRKREKGIARGEITFHDSSRELVTTDNSPASWSYMAAFSGQRPSLDDVRRELDGDAIPVAMVVDREMRARARYKCCRISATSPNKLGWKVCHKRGVGLHGRTSLKQRPITDLYEHFRNFMSPSNIFLVPLFLGGLGEVPHFIEAISHEPYGL